MSLATVGLSKGIGEGLIAMGGDVQTVFTQDTANRVEAIKQNRLEGMADRQQNIENIFKLDQRATQKSQFAEEQAFARDQAATQQSQFERTQTEAERATLAQEEANRIEEERLRKEGEARIAQGWAGLGIEEKRVAISQGTLDQSKKEWDDQMDLEDRKLFEQASVNRFNEAMANKNFAMAEAELEFQKEKFGYQKSLDDLKLDLERESLRQNQTQFDSTISIREQELQIAKDKLEFDKLTTDQKIQLERDRFDLAESAQEYAQMDSTRQIEFLKEKFGLTHGLAVEKQAFLEKTDAEQMAFLREKFEREKLDSDDRKALANREADIREELKELERLKVDIDTRVKEQDILYRKALEELQKNELDLKRQGLAIEKEQLVIAQGAANRSKWKIVMVPIYEDVLTKEANPETGDPAEYAQQKVGEKIVVINMDDPKLQDIREYDNNQWTGGNPELEFVKEALSEIEALRKEQGISFSEAVDQLKDMKEYKKFNWTMFDKMMVATAPAADTIPSASSTDADTNADTGVATGADTGADTGQATGQITGDDAGPIRSSASVVNQPEVLVNPSHDELQAAIAQYMEENPGVSRYDAYQILTGKVSPDDTTEVEEPTTEAGGISTGRWVRDGRGRKWVED